MIKIYRERVPRNQDGSLVTDVFLNQTIDEVSHESPVIEFTSPGNVLNPDNTRYFAYAKDLVQYFNTRPHIGVATRLRNGTLRDPPVGPPNGPIDPIHHGRFSPEDELKILREIQPDS